MGASENMKSDNLSWKPLKDRIHWLLEANRLFKETHQRIGRLEENRLLFYLIKFCTIDTDQPHVSFSSQQMASLPDLPIDAEALKDVLRRLRGHSFWVAPSDASSGLKTEILTSWIDHVSYDVASDRFDVSLSAILYPYIACLHERFQAMEADSTTSDPRLKSKYSNRLYELLRVHEKATELPLTLEQLRYLMDVGTGKLERWVDLKRRVIEPAVEEINETGIFQLTYEPVKQGRSVAQVRFLIERP